MDKQLGCEECRCYHSRQETEEAITTLGLIGAVPKQAGMIMCKTTRQMRELWVPAQQRHSPLHQLDFHCTVWCGNKEALLELERLLKLSHCFVLAESLFKVAERGRHLGGFMVEVDSIDINWADDEPADSMCECCEECPCTCGK